MLHNLMEDVVKQLFDDVISLHPEICQCDHCRHDIMAVALNHLPPRYVVTVKGEVYTKINMLAQQFRIDAIAAIAQGMVTVTKKPRHDKDPEA
ncbi:late competence development ComFB family protein [Heliorestis acidaminivorans]|uniref:Late competence development ComFB family protein n=1 Tax=Heliorestis acidaminivorans TaxID=553427 RepID=A0A6I0EWZ5_9FIRM|nr:late competence development ComFB family protein [Heliorestis acidaminivorans]KAB2951663.1 late competence development ComFB family protein [Heliorestis acidaminivorans]